MEILFGNLGTEYICMCIIKFDSTSTLVPKKSPNVYDFSARGGETVSVVKYNVLDTKGEGWEDYSPVRVR